VTTEPERRVENAYREIADRLWRAVWAYSGDREMASDAVSEAFAQVLARGDDVRDPAKWVWTAAFRIAAGELKARARRPEARPEPEGPPDVVDLVRALGRLSPKQRAAILLHHYAGYPVGDVARMIGSTAGAIRVHLSVGRKRLRELLEVRDG
jgi:RNA polymerase sigma-70 factor (ECF subfamily)